MLISFRVSNFRSLRDPQDLSLLRTKRFAGTEPPAGWRPHVSTVAAIYGANASGKSSLYKALQFLRRAVVESYRRWDADDIIPAIPFFLNLESFREPTEFEIDFTATDGIQYQYGFSTSRERILNEWLYVYRTSHRSVLYERGLSDDSGIHFGPSFRGSRNEMKAAVQNRPNALSLSVGGQAKVDAIMPVYDWIRRNLRFYDASDFLAEHSKVISQIATDEKYRLKLSAMLAQADLGVTEIHAIEEDEDTSPSASSDDSAAASSPMSEPSQFDAITKKRAWKLVLRHAGDFDEATASFPFTWESEGTRALVSFASVAIWSLEGGGTLVVDEIDTSLHPLLVRELIAVYQDHRTNPRQAQLIFTTHDVSLLAKSPVGEMVLGRDQVWMVEKDTEGASSLVGLSEYRSPRTDENLERGYLTGRFGGVPNISLRDALLELEERDTETPDQSSIET